MRRLLNTIRNCCSFSTNTKNTIFLAKNARERKKRVLLKKNTNNHKIINQNVFVFWRMCYLLPSGFLCYLAWENALDVEAYFTHRVPPLWSLIPICVSCGIECF